MVSQFNKFLATALMLVACFCLVSQVDAKHHRDGDVPPNTTAAIDPSLAHERILVMRHAEKPDDDGDPNLTQAGYQRAATLAKYIPEQFGFPNFIFAAANSKHSSRPYETALPMCQFTGTPVSTFYSNDDVEQLAANLLSNPAYNGKTIVLIWHHGKIPQLLNALHAKTGTYPEKWPSKCFNEIVQLDYVGQNHPVVTEIKEPF